MRSLRGLLSCRAPRGAIALRLALLLLLVMLVSSVSSCTSRAQGNEELVVPLQVVEGPNGAVLALVPVFIQGQGPFAFALDTGASQSLIDQDIVDRLDLPVEGEAGEVTGITGSTQAELVRVTEWRLGDVALPETLAITLDLAEPNRGRGLRGLLGSDVLSQYGAVTIDYEQERLVLHERDGE